MPETSDHDIASALSKIGSERQKVLDEAKAIIRRNDRDELLFLLIHQNHLMKVVKTKNADKLDSGTKALCRVSADAYAFALQLTYKYGRPKSGVVIEDYERLFHISLFVNHGLEMESMLKYLPFRRFGERLQHFKVYLDGMFASDTKARLFHYAARHEMDSGLREARTMTVTELITELFSAEMDDEFRTVFGLSTDEAAEFYSELTTEVSKKLLAAEEKMMRIGDRIDVMHLDSFRAARFAYTVNYNEFLNRFGAKKQRFRTFLLRQSLLRAEIDDLELRYFRIWRRHILRLDRNHFTLSPEISMFSPNFALHYDLMEDPRTKDSYQAKRSKQFQRRIEAVLDSVGLRIIDRNVNARANKRDLGDVDILAEDNKTIFNIECKGEVLPLRVYFHDHDYILNTHLPYLRDTKGWDKKTTAREKWLMANRKQLGLSEEKDIISIIVSDSPEIISHYSDTLCLSLHEFPLWYKKTLELNRFVSFNEFQEQVLTPRMATLNDTTRNEVERYFGMRFEHE